MQFKNNIVNYFVSPPSSSGGVPRVFRAPVTISSDIARGLIEKKFRENDASAKVPYVLHVCYDFDSGMIYSPNKVDFSKQQSDLMMQAAQARITKDFGNFSAHPVIEGSPYSSLRVRSLESFPYTHKVVSEHYEGRVFKNIPVLEVNLARMPTTVKSLPPQYQGEGYYPGGYIGPKDAESITFIDEIDNKGNVRRHPIILFTQKTPFILINMERERPTSTEKEWIVLEGYRNYLYDNEASSEERYINNDINTFADLYAVKRYLYLGWSFEEVSSTLMQSANNFPSMLKAIHLLMVAANDLEREGYTNPAKIPYYITFKVDPKKFPLKLEIVDGRVGLKNQLEYFKVLDFDQNTSYILIETPVYLNNQMCVKILKAEGNPLVTRYNPISNSIDVKSNVEVYNRMRAERKQLAKIEALTKHGIDDKIKSQTVKFRTGVGAEGVSLSNPTVYNTRKISDYYYAADYIKKMCEEANQPFFDMEVIVGPIEYLFGRGTRGGFITDKTFKENGMDIPTQIAPGLWVTPPLMMINSIQMPSYAEQTETLIHEYQHYLYSLTHDSKPQYGSFEGLSGDESLRNWYLYFTDPDEMLAHKRQVKFALMSGKSVDEIIRDKVGGAITLDNYPIALKYGELVKEALRELEEEGAQDEEPIGEGQFD